MNEELFQIQTIWTVSIATYSRIDKPGFLDSDRKTGEGGELERKKKKCRRDRWMTLISTVK